MTEFSLPIDLERWLLDRELQRIRDDLMQNIPPDLQFMTDFNALSWDVLHEYARPKNRAALLRMARLIGVKNCRFIKNALSKDGDSGFFIELNERKKPPPKTKREKRRFRLQNEGARLINFGLEVLDLEAGGTTRDAALMAAHSNSGSVRQRKRDFADFKNIVKMRGYIPNSPWLNLGRPRHRLAALKRKPGAPRKGDTTTK